MSQLATSPDEALLAMPHDVAIIKIEQDTIMAAALAHPKRREDMIAHIKQEFDLFPAIAEKALYSKPIGKAKNPKTGAYDGPQQYATGLSIRAAEMIAEAYGFNRVCNSVRDLDDDTAEIEARYISYQSCRQWTEKKILSKWYKSAGGTMVRHRDDRFYNVVCKAEMSKLIRECILRVSPASLKAAIELMAAKIQSELLTPQTKKNILDWFTSKGVDALTIETHLGRKQDSWTKNDFATLQGIKNAIEDGECTVAEAFGEQKPQTAATPTGGVSGADLTGAASNDMADDQKPFSNDPADQKENLEPPPAENRGELVSPDRLEVLNTTLAQAREAKIDLTDILGGKWARDLTPKEAEEAIAELESKLNPGGGKRKKKTQ